MSPSRRRSNEAGGLGETGDADPASGAASSARPGLTPASAATRRSRLTKQVVFFMLIGWLVLVLLVVVLISAT